MSDAAPALAPPDSSAEASSSIAAAPASSAPEDAAPALLPGGFHAFRPVYDSSSSALTDSTPLTSALLTVRVVKSFAYRTMKACVLPQLDLTRMTVGELRERVKHEVRTKPEFKGVRSRVAEYDTLKIYTHAHASKTTNLIINLDRPEWILLDDAATLESVGCRNETELSLFNRAEYEEFLLKPDTTSW